MDMSNKRRLLLEADAGTVGILQSMVIVSIGEELLAILLCLTQALSLGVFVLMVVMVVVLVCEEF